MPDETSEERKARQMREIEAFRTEHGLSPQTRLAMKPCDWTGQVCFLCIAGCRLLELAQRDGSKWAFTDEQGWHKVDA